MTAPYDRDTGRALRLCRRGATAGFCRRLAGSLTFLLLLAPLQQVLAAAPDGVSDSVRAQIRALQQEKAKRTPAQNKMDSHLIYGARQRLHQPLALGVTNLPPMLKYEADSRVSVDIDAEVTDAVLAAIAQAGGTVINQVPGFKAIRALLPLDQVEALAGRNDISFIRPAVPAMTNTGSVNSQGDAAHGANLARVTYGVDGTGIKVGVLSDSVDYLANSQASGDLGTVTVLPGQSGSGAGEGTAMLEIVHDLAPGAALYFATAFGSEAQFAQNILDLRAAGCDIIVDDVSYFDEPPFQDGIVAQSVNAVTAAGALYFSSAGNSGNKEHFTSGTWEGDFVDGGAAGALYGGDSAGRLHNFGGVTYNTVITVGGYGRADLFWSDPWGAAANDYDLYVLNSTGTAIDDVSNNRSGIPWEACALQSVGERIVIVLYSGTSRFLHLESGRGQLTYNTAGMTRGHNAASNAITVAAVDAKLNAYPGLFAGGWLNMVESFSSDGPRRIFFTPTGTALTPGNYSSTGGVLLQKPDIAAADGVTTSVTGFAPFYGTSAAAPHAGAIAALVWSFDHSMSAATVRNALTSTALDIETTGVDISSGVGLVMAQPALDSVAAASPPLFLSAKMQETTGNGNGLPDPGETISEWIVWTNRSAMLRTNITATLTSPTPGVTILQGSSPYPNMPSRTSASNTVAFSYRLAKSIPLGTVAIFSNRLTSGSVIATATFTRVIGPTTYATNTYAGSFTANAIPDAVGVTPGTVYSNIQVSAGAAVLDDVNVALRIDHTWDRDLEIAVQHPDSTAVLLTTKNFIGASPAPINFGAGYAPGAVTNTVLDDQAPLAISNGAAPFLGSFKPVGSPTNKLSNLNNKAASGTWRLRVSDMVMYETGTLYQWSLTLATHVNGIYNSTPVASNQSVAVVVGAATNLVLCGSDPDGDPFVFRMVGAPAHGALQGMNTNSGAVTYLATNNYAGADSFSFVVNDGYVDSAVATVGVSIVSAATNSLAVVSARGGTLPGTLSAGTYSFVSQWVTNSPVTGGTTQYVCLGGTVAGNAFTPASATNVTLTLTNDATLTWSWQTSYRLFVTTNGPGTVALSTPATWYVDGSNVALTATPNAQYRFNGWSGDTLGCAIAGNVITASMTQARMIAAAFVPAVQTLTVVSANGGVTPGTVTVGYGSNTTQWVINSPLSGGVGTQFVCVGATVVGNDFTLLSATNVMLTLTNDATLTWNWQTQCWMTATTNGPGTVAPASGWFAAESNATFTATPVTYWHVADWSGTTAGCTAVGNTLSAPATQTRSLTVSFAIDRPVLTISTPWGVAKPSAGSYTNNAGTNVTAALTNSPVTSGTTQYVCRGWAGTGSAPASGVTTNTGPFLIAVDSIVSWLWTTNYWLSITNAANGRATGPGGWNAYGSNAVVTATASNHYHFAQWTGAGVPAGSESNNPVTLPMDRARAVTATFAIDQEALVIVSPYGSPAPPAGTNWYSYNSNITTRLAGSPASNGTTQYFFRSWTRTGSTPASGTTTNPGAFALTNDSVVTWIWGTNYWLATASVGSGKVNVASTWYGAGSNVTLVATASNHCHLVNWTGDTNGCTFSSNTITAAMDAPHSITANFAIDQYPLTVTTPYGLAYPPAGTNWLDYNRSLQAAVTNSPAVDGGTQYVCRGWTGTGSVPVSGTATNTATFSFLTNSTVTWLWRTNYWLDLACNGQGGLSATDAWLSAGTNLQVTATPSNHWHFAQWTGATNGCVIATNRITAAMTQARAISANFAIDRHQLVVTTPYGLASPPAGTNGLDYASTNQAAITNDPVILGGTQYVCHGWTGTGNVPASGASTNTGNFLVTTNSTVTWLWQTNYWLGLSAAGGGSLNITSGWLAAGTNQSVTATASNHFHFVQWSGDTNGCSLAGNTLTAVLSLPRNIAAVFDADQYTLTVATPYGLASPPAGASAFDYGTSLAAMLTNSPVLNGATQYVCRGWVGAGSAPANGNDTNTGSFLLTTNATVTWLWTTNYWLSLAAGSGGSLDAASGWSASGTNRMVTATPSNGWRFVQWTGDTNGCVVAANTINVAMGCPRAIGAIFAVAQVTLTVTTPFGLAWPAAGANPVLYGSTNAVAITNAPVIQGGTQYVCLGWSGTGSAPASGAGTNTGAFAVTGDSAVTWIWSTNYWLHVDSGANGSAAPSDVWRGQGSNVQVTATPAVYYGVAGWSGQTNGGSVTGNQIAVVMDSARTLQVQFTALLTTNNTPHWWLAQYGLTNGGFDASALLDTDGDGMANWEEYVAGTDPTNAASVLHIANFTPGSLAFTPAFTSRIYAVFGATNLVSPNWLPLSAYQPGTGSVTALAATNAAPQIFYRVGVQVP